jgi:histone deacetylase 1/2
MSANDEPQTYREAVSSIDGDKWRSATQEEFDAHEKNKTWSVVKREKWMNVIGSKWVNKRKRDVKGEVIRYKSRIVAKGFNQVEGIDYNETFAPVLKYKSLRIILALSLNSKLKQLDVKTAFLNATVSENIYMSAPDGLDIPSDCVLKLNKALYGIKQAPNEWNAEITKFMIHELKMKQCIKDQCVFVSMSKNNNPIIIGLFVDDFIAKFEEEDEEEYLMLYEKRLKDKYELSDLGEVNHILGMRVTKSDNTITIDQKTYIEEKLKSFNMHQCNGATTPESLDKLKKVEKKNEIIENVNEYRSIVGSEIYAAISTRPDIAHAVNMVSRHMQEPSQAHMTAAKRILRYLHETKELGLVYKNEEKSANEKKKSIRLEGYCDADWGGDLDGRKSTNGYCVFLNGCLVSWNTHKQATVAHSSAESELMGACDVVKELMWMSQLLKEMHYDVEMPIIVYIDNQSAMKIAQHDVDHTRTKHIDIKYHFIRDEIREKKICLQWISTQKQIADIFTKGLSHETFRHFRDMLVSKV